MKQSMTFYIILTLGSMAMATPRPVQIKEQSGVCHGRYEAQFVGQVQDVVFSAQAEAGNIEHTTYGIGQFSFYQENQRCPLDISLAKEAHFWVQNFIDIKSGDPISGVLVYDAKTHFFVIK